MMLATRKIHIYWVFLYTTFQRICMAKWMRFDHRHRGDLTLQCRRPFAPQRLRRRLYVTNTYHQWQRWSGKTGEFRVGSVGSSERRFSPNSTQASLFFRSAVTIAPFTGLFFVLLAERLKQAVLLLNKLFVKPVMRTTSDCYRYFLRDSSAATYYKRGIVSQTK